MWWQLFFEQLHFSLHIFAALIFFAVSWLYFDAWQARKSRKELLRSGGFLLLAISFLVEATILEVTFLPSPFLDVGIQFGAFAFFRTIGLILVAVSLAIDPLPIKPKTENPFGSGTQAFLVPTAFVGVTLGLSIAQAILSCIIGILYLRRATTGLERHLRPVFISFFVLALSLYVSSFRAFRDTTNPSFYSLVAPFGPLWFLQQCLTLLSSLILVRWVFGYLLKRFETQLFFIFTTGIVMIFIVTTFVFTTLLFSNMQDEALRQLTIDNQLLRYALEQKKGETLSDAQVISQNPQIVEKVGDTSDAALRDIVESWLVGKKKSSLILVGRVGQVLARGEDKERFGDSLSDDPLVKKGLLGQEGTTYVTRDGVVGKEIIISAASPVKRGDQTVGVVLASFLLDGAFLDGVKKETGLESTVYAQNQISATTLVGSDGSTRPIGILEKNPAITAMVLDKGETYKGSATFLGQPYLTIYSPFKDTDGTTLGMIFIGRPQESMISAVGRSVELTFIAVIILLIVSLFPSYIVSQYIKNQVR